MKLRLVCLSLLAMAISSCAWTAQKAQLRPQTSVQSTDLGGGATVYVNAVDERPSDVLGNRAAGAVGAEISASTADVVTAVNQSLTSGLRGLGFNPSATASPGAAELRVEIRALTYKVSQGFWTLPLDVDAALKAICLHGKDRGHEQLHRGHYEDSLQVVQGASNNDQYINQALSSAINEILLDRPLMTCLASRDGSGAAAGAP